MRAEQPLPAKRTRRTIRNREASNRAGVETDDTDIEIQIMIAQAVCGNAQWEGYSAKISAKGISMPGNNGVRMASISTRGGLEPS